MSSKIYDIRNVTHGSAADIPPDSPVRHVAALLGITGGTHATVAACATGTLAVIRAVRWIARGEAEMVLAGGADASLHRLWIAAFERMGVLAPPHPQLGPAWACRPFDRTRAGFAVGEGAAILVLESGKSVHRRGVPPLARISGEAWATDPTGLIQPSPNAIVLERVMRTACYRAGRNLESIGCIQAHGTGTLANDGVEARAVRQIWGSKAPAVPIISLKGAMGHLLGAAGAVELAAAVLACRDGRIPGNATLIEPDPQLGELDLPQLTGELQDATILKTSMGFGGHVAAVLIERP